MPNASKKGAVKAKKQVKPAVSSRPTIAELRKIISRIEPDRLYTPYEIAQEGLVLNTRFQTSYRHVYRLIQQGAINAIDVTASDSNPRYHVRGKEIQKYLKSRYDL